MAKKRPTKPINAQKNEPNGEKNPMNGLFHVSTDCF